MLSLKDISKSFGGTKVLQNVSFDIPVGKVTALIGPNGAGKTTLFDVVSGIVRQDSGSLLLRVGKEMRDISAKETFERMRLGISRTFQQVKLCENLTIEDHFQMVEDNEDELFFKNVIPNFLWDPETKNKQKKNSFDFLFSFLDSLFQPEADLPQARRGNDRKEEEKKMGKIYQEFLKSLDLQKPLETRVLDLSYGQRKLLDLGLAIYHQHSVLLLDEPVAGVNQVIRKRIHALLEDLKKRGETVLLIEHDIEFVRELADEVIVLDEGKVLTSGAPEQVLTDKRVLEAYLGE